MKFSLISATSIFALFSAAVGPAHAVTLSTAPGQPNIYDLVHDGVTSSDGGDRTVTSQDPLISATMALEAASSRWQAASFTGPVIAVSGYPTTPLGAAPGTKPDDDLASSIAGTEKWDAVQKARAIGQYRIAALIGTIGRGPMTSDKAGSTVFVAAGSPIGFNDGGSDVEGVRGSPVDYVSAPSSSSTATITVAGAGNMPRRGLEEGFSVAAANSLQVSPPVVRDAAPAMALSDTAQPTLGYNYAPASKSIAGANAVAASFSDAVTANGMFAQATDPAARAKVQTSQLQVGQGQARRFQTSEAAPSLLDLSASVEGPHNGNQIDGTRTFISASVSANPTAIASSYMANVVNATRSIPAGQSVEAFEVGPSAGPKTQANRGSTVAEPLHGKVMASAGALNNSLALP